MVVGGSGPNLGHLAVRRIPTLIIWPFCGVSIESRLLQWMPLDRYKRLFDDDPAFHVVVPRPTDDAAVHGKCPGFVRLELDLGGQAFFYRLVDAEGVNVEAVLGV